MLRPAIPRPGVVRGLAAGALWVVLLWGWLTGYGLLGRTVSNVVRASAFTMPSG
jgi:hypothetical protein